MPEFIFRGTIALSGVDFFITADTPLEAVKKAKAGEYDYYDTAGAETTDWQIDPLTGEDNA